MTVKKRSRSPSLPLHDPQHSSPKKTRVSSTLVPTFTPVKIASAETAAAVDAQPPLLKLLNCVATRAAKPAKGDSVVYWMRMGDLRIYDNRALSLASKQAKKDNLPLIVLFILSPQDYIAHDRGAKRIDFTLRNLAIIQEALSKLDIPLKVITHPVRRTLPTAAISFTESIHAKHLYGNIEYEVDELRRDISICEIARKHGISAQFVHNKCVVEPGVVRTKQDRAYTVYSPYQRNWISKLNDGLSHFLENCAPPSPNDPSIRQNKLLSGIFDEPCPVSLAGFELSEEDKQMMQLVWPAGESVALEMLQRFLRTKARPSQLGPVDPLAPGAEESDKKSRVAVYQDGRNRADIDSSSRLSPYLAAGVISVRACIRATMELRKSKTVDSSRQNGMGVWVQEIAWRDFYVDILASFPRVSMGRPFLEKYADVVWEDYQEDQPRAKKEEAKAEQGVSSLDPQDAIQRWKDGLTGYPIVDAAMRCIKEMGWVHNRLRMIAAMFLVKDLMIDWRVGERYFMEQLMDGDLASNNGGWQWSASTGTDAAPYFRIFNPYSQSQKADPSGELIRRFVPELAELKGRFIIRQPR
ncbi:hypothetical protein HGRIS_009483 [Hohenbuehelia grisea]|uniref:Photolyase/cryptochrome alpha/beta domain-containing protein n=1 Tax=Hohenbuehelia grisea TaxID=104357 RepID=A0ABR3J1G3_9AGAR